MPVEMNQEVKPDLCHANTPVKKRVFSGIQPTGNLTWATTLAQSQLGRKPRQSMTTFSALSICTPSPCRLIPRSCITARANSRLVPGSGLDMRYCKLFVQSHVHEHAEISWILDCFTPMGWLNRMTQFKSKAGENTDAFSTGLYCYPALMASDILLYHTHFVPVGDDQRQHVEFTRDLAQRFNCTMGNRYSPFLRPRFARWAHASWRLTIQRVR